MDPKAIGAHIRMKRPELTPLELNVVDNIIAKADFNEQSSIKDIAKETGVSEAMLVKIAKKLDFSGFRELRTAIVLYHQQEVAQLYEEIAPDDDMGQLVSKVFRNSIQAIEETMAILDVNELKRCVTFIDQAQEILLCGVGGSAEIARDLAHKFLRIGIKTEVYEDAHMMLMASSLCHDHSVMIAVSHSGRTLDVIESVTLAKSQGARVIVLTNYATSPLAQKADVVLSSTSRGSPLLGENAAARIAMLNILDVIYVAITQLHPEKAQQNLNKTRNAVCAKRIK